ncbi:DNA-binding protein [Candidatus Micrarchaeota archaeon]|nr:DNA-binding protein [Candidatus Micrarchaeota archaeon]
MDENEQEEYGKRAEEAQHRAQQDAALKNLLRKMLEPEAYERIQNIKLSNPELYAQLIKMIAYLQQSGQLKSKVSEVQLKQIVSRILSQRKETSIRFARK